MQKRRDFLLQSSSIAISFLGSSMAWAQPTQNTNSVPSTLVWGEKKAFSFETLTNRAKTLSQSKYIDPTVSHPGVLDRLGYDEVGQIRYRSDLALFNEKNLYPITFFHMGNFFRFPVKMYTLDLNAASTSTPNYLSRELRYQSNYFDMPSNSPAKELKSNIGFAGFKIQEKNGGSLDSKTNDWVAFLGASYFRAIGSLQQYGLSARGLAVNSGIDTVKEDFPNFTEFYFAPQKENDTEIVVYALLESQTVVGAYQFKLKRGQAVDMEVSAQIFVRQTNVSSITRLLMAPLTSMYWYSELNRKTAGDWRPEIHDSDGLSIATGHGEWIWRPLNNPTQVSVSAFADNQPKGFGLIQRDRNFENYLDGVHYERRPNLWVEPVSGFEAGSVQLIELPTQDETNDNIVVGWVPQKEAKPGESYSIAYRLYWSDKEKTPNVLLARCVSTRTGFGGQPGQRRKEKLTKFVVEFLGGSLASFTDKPDIVLESAGGVFSTILWERVFYEGYQNAGKKDRLRIQFDFEPQKEVSDLKLYLKNKDITLTETWVYQLKTPGVAAAAISSPR